MAIGAGNLTYPINQTTAGWRKPSLDLFSRIINISPTDYVFFSHTDNVKTNNVLTQWQLRRLPSRAFDGITRQEGADFSYRDVRQPTRVSNTAHILWIGVELSETAIAESHFGIASLWNDQLNDAMEVWKGAAERAFIRSTESTGATNGARYMDGLLASITTNASTGPNGNNATLDETGYINLLRLVWDKGPRARDVMMNASLQMVVDQFNAVNGTKQVFVTDEGITNMVTFYRSSFGVVRNHLTRDLEDGDGTAEMVALDFKNFHKAWLRRVHMRPIASDADAMRSAVVGETTLKYDDEQAAAKYTAMDTNTLST